MRSVSACVDGSVQVPVCPDRPATNGRVAGTAPRVDRKRGPIANRESRTVASIVNELLYAALRDYRSGWIPNEHLPLFNDRATRVLDFAAVEAESLGHNYLGTEHLLLGLLREDEGAAARYLLSRGLDLDHVRDAVVKVIGRRTSATPGELVPRARRALALAVDEVQRLGHGRVGTEHILQGIAREGQGVAAGILDRLGIDLEQLRQRKLTALSQID
jgi:hypothetical protein